MYLIPDILKDGDFESIGLEGPREVVVECISGEAELELEDLIVRLSEDELA